MKRITKIFTGAGGKDADKDGGKSGGNVLYMVALAALGVAFIALGKFWGGNRDAPAASSPPSAFQAETGATGAGTAFGAATTDSSLRAFEKAAEERLTAILSQIEGAGDVAVMLTVGESAETVPAADVHTDVGVTREEDDQGGKRETQTSKTQTTTLFSKNGGDIVRLKELSPKISGVLIVADGGGDGVTKEALTKAAASALGIEVHKVTVVKRAVNNR